MYQENDTNEYPNIFVSTKLYEYDTNEYLYRKIFEYIRISVTPWDGSLGGVSYRPPPVLIMLILKKIPATGIITSPNYPRTYPKNLNKTDMLRVQEGMFVSLHITAFDIEATYGTNRYENEFYGEEMEYDLYRCPDHLTIADDDGTIFMGGWGDGMGGRWDGCGFVDVTLPIDITSTSNTVKLVFRTDNYDQSQDLDDHYGILYGKHSGWRVSWSAVTPGECQQHL